jgi:hypothetical protein
MSWEGLTPAAMAGVPGEAECAGEVGWGDPTLLAHLRTPGEA